MNTPALLVRSHNSIIYTQKESEALLLGERLADPHAERLVNAGEAAFFVAITPCRMLFTNEEAFELRLIPAPVDNGTSWLGDLLSAVHWYWVGDMAYVFNKAATCMASLYLNRYPKALFTQLYRILYPKDVEGQDNEAVEDMAEAHDWDSEWSNYDPDARVDFVTQAARELREPHMVFNDDVDLLNHLLDQMPCYGKREGWYQIPAFVQ